MIRSAFGIRLSVAVVLVSLTPSPAWAQRVTGPYAGLFGGEQNGDVLQPVTTLLEVRGSLFGAYEDVSVPEAATAVDPRSQANGGSGGVNGSLSYNRRSEHTRVRIGSGGSLRRYATSDPFSASSYDAAAFMRTDVGSKSTFEGRASMAYSRLYQFAPFLDAAVPDIAPITTGFAHATQWEPNLVVDGTAVFTTNISRRSSVSGDVRWHKWRFFESPDHDLLRRGAHGRFQHRLTRGLGFHLGYGRDYNDSTIAAAAAPLYETYDVGLDYGDTLAVGRRTALSFTTATGVMRYLGDTHYRLNGSASLVRGFGRTWSASLGYRRTTEVRPEFLEPLLSDSLGTSVGGLLGRRLNLTANGGYSRGTVGFSDVRPFTSYSASTNLVVGVTRSAGIYGQYTYYRYAVPSGSTALDFLSTFARQSVSVGLTVWAPIINETRAPRDTR